jgi:hypothetical protein
MTQIEIEYVLRPGSTHSVDAETYAAMKQACVTVLTKAPPGVTVAEIGMRLLMHRSDTHTSRTASRRVGGRRRFNSTSKPRAWLRAPAAVRCGCTDADQPGPLAAEHRR